MSIRILALLAFTATILAACSKPAEPEAAATSEPAATTSEETGLQIKTLTNGHGEAAEAGDYVTVHYTGWLYDETAPDNRGEKFDSSVDRGERFQFPLGAGRVIKGWDEGVAGMLIGEKRELTIPPEMGYGMRDVGPIPAGSTLIFEVELFATGELPEGS